MRDREAARADAARHADGVDQDVAVVGHRRLHDGAAVPCVLPEQRAVGRRDAHHARPAEQHDLLDTVNRHQCGEL